jgi:hypothetical protein
VLVDTPVTLTASYTENDVKVHAEQTITISAAPATLDSLSVSGGTSVLGEGLLRLSVAAIYTDGSQKTVNASNWSVNPTALGSVNSRGEFTAAAVTADTPVTLTASYSEGDITQTASIALTIKATPTGLTSLGIVLAKASLAVGESIKLVAESGYADGSSKRIMVDSWSVSDPAVATIVADGTLTAQAVTMTSPVIVTARYSEGGKTLEARYTVIVQAVAEPPKLSAEVLATSDADNLSTIKLWFNTDAGATVRASRASKRYKIFVAALLPASPLVGPEPTVAGPELAAGGIPVGRTGKRLAADRAAGGFRYIDHQRHANHRRPRRE